MKKLIISITILVLILVWGLKFYKLNHGFNVNTPNPKVYYSMNEKVDLGSNMSFGGIENNSYSISLDDAQIVETDDILRNSNILNNYPTYGEKCLILSFTIFNDGINENEFNLLSFPVMGLNWYTIFSYEITNYLNLDINDNLSFGGSISIPKGETVKINVAYELYKANFSNKNWNKLEEQDMWVWVTISPLDQRIKISF